MVVDQSRMELAALLGLYYSTISRLVNPVDKHQKKKPDHPAGNFNPYAGQRALYFGF
jgi:hypothetical protein